MKAKTVIAIAASILFLQIAIGLGIYYFGDSWESRAAFGDMFGAINTLFSGLAFAGVIYSILMQGQELKLQREELSLTREELQKSASAQELQTVRMLNAANISAAGSKVQCFSLLYANNKKDPNSRGFPQDSLKKAITELEALTKEP